MPRDVAWTAVHFMHTLQAPSSLQHAVLPATAVVNGCSDHLPMLQATQAYQAGNKALAKELGAKGRAHAEKMQAAHAVASEAIFRERNAHRECTHIQLRMLYCSSPSSTFGACSVQGPHGGD